MTPQSDQPNKRSAADHGRQAVQRRGHPAALNLIPVTDADWEAWLRRVARFPGWGVTGLPPVAAHRLTGTDLAGQVEPPLSAVTAAGLWDALTWLARREGFAVDRADCGTHSAETSWATRRIRISSGLDASSAALSLTHELGHVLAHTGLMHVPGATTAECNGIRKIEADSIAFIMAARLGMDTSSYSWPYVASWAGTDARAHPGETVRAAGERITSAATAITTHLDVALFGRPSQYAAVVPVVAHQPPPASEREGEAGTSPSPIADTPRRGHAAVPADKGADRGTGPPPAVLRRVLLDAEGFYRAHLADSWAPAYLGTRGLSAHVIMRWRIGYAPGGWTALTGHLRRLGYDASLIEAAGLARRSSRGTLIDHFRDRVMLATRDERGMIAGFIGRAHPNADPAVPKYLNSPETSLYRKGNLLFGLHEAPHQLTGGAVPVIVEGPFDAIAVTTADQRRYAGLAPCGTALTSRQVAALARVTDLAHTGVLMALDGDRAGHDGIIKAYELLLTHTSKTMAAILPSEHDPAEILQSGGPTALCAALDRSEPLARVVIDTHIDRWSSQLDHVEGRLAAMRSAAQFIARTLPSEIAARIQQITCGQGIETLDEHLHHVPNPELSVIARLLPPGAACQIVRVADRTGYASDEVTAEVANTVVKAATSPKGRAMSGGILADVGRPIVSADADAVSLSAPSFPVRASCGSRIPGPATRSSRSPIRGQSAGRSVRSSKR